MIFRFFQNVPRGSIKTPPKNSRNRNIFWCIGAAKKISFCINSTITEMRRRWMPRTLIKIMIFPENFSDFGVLIFFAFNFSPENFSDTEDLGYFHSWPFVGKSASIRSKLWEYWGFKVEKCCGLLMIVMTVTITGRGIKNKSTLSKIPYGAL